MTGATLDWEACVAAVRALEGGEVSVRIVLRHHPEDLVAVFHGVLGALMEDSKRPSLFWPLGENAGHHAEQPGIYLRRDDFEGGEARAGGVLVIEQAEIALNVRPLL